MTTDTPTPRADFNKSSGAWPCIHGRPCLCGVSPEHREAIIAALAASAGPLSAEELTRINRQATSVIQDEIVTPAKMVLAETILKLLTAYTALAAECAQVTKERDALAADVLDFRGHEREIERYRYCDDCGRRMVWTSAQGESWVCPYHIWRRMKDAESDLAALRATVAEYREVVDGFVNHGDSLGYSHPQFAAYRAYPSALWDSADALLARTPTPEEQG